MTFFKTLHPLVRFTYICLLFLSIVTGGVVTLIITTFGFCLYSYYGEFIGKIIKKIPFFLLIFVLSVILTVLFNHRGRQILFYLFDRPITGEAIFWGIKTGLCLVCLLILFLSAEHIISSLEVLYIFRSVPILGIAFQMTLAAYRRIFASVSDTEACLALKGISIHSGKFKNRVNATGHMLNALLIISMEGIFDRAKTLKIRGFGVMDRRTSVIQINFRVRDLLWLLFSCLFFAVWCVIYFFGMDYVVIAMSAYFLFCLMPVFFAGVYKRRILRLGEWGI